MTDRRNVVLVTVDSLRADHCGFEGYDRATTPTLDDLAADGLVFADAIAPGPSTPESMSAVHTGEFLRPYHDEGSTIVRRRRNVRRHLRENPTIAETLSDEGYTAVGFSPNPFTSRYFGFDRGFDHYTDFLEADRTLGGVYDRVFRRFVGGETALSPLRLALNWVEREEVFKTWEEYYDAVVEAVAAAGEPYFLWVFLLDTHLPYLAGREDRDGVSWAEMWRYNLRLYRGDPPRFSADEREALVSLYDATVRRVDRFVGRLLADLGDTDPVVVFHADHGEAFGEHGTYGHEPYPYEENVRVPLVVANGDRRGVVPGPTSLRTVPAQVYAAAGVDPPGSGRGVTRSPGSGRGVTRSPESGGGRLAGPEPARGDHEGDRCVLINPAGMRSALRTDRWKYVWTDDPATGRELYDLAADPGERENLLAEGGDDDGKTGSGTTTEAAAGFERLARRRLAGEREKLAVSNAVRALTREGST